MKVKASEIENLNAGTRVCINGEWYLVLSKSRNFSGIVAHLDTGATGHWSRLIEFDQDVELK